MSVFYVKDKIIDWVLLLDPVFKPVLVLYFPQQFDVGRLIHATKKLTYKQGQNYGSQSGVYDAWQATDEL